jgi:RNA polymerase sigma-70 factor (ECF subfamily)
VSLTFFEDRSAEEIAETLATTAGHVRVLRHRAIASLRRCLDGAGPTDREETSS